MYGFKHSDTCIINKIIQKYVTKFFLPSILVQELLHLKKYPMAMQLFHNIITCTHILQIQSNKLHPLPSRIVYGFQDSVNTYKSSMHSFTVWITSYTVCAWLCFSYTCTNQSFTHTYHPSFYKSNKIYI